MDFFLLGKKSGESLKLYILGWSIPRRMVTYMIMETSLIFYLINQVKPQLIMKNDALNINNCNFSHCFIIKRFCGDIEVERPTFDRGIVSSNPTDRDLHFFFFYPNFFQNHPWFCLVSQIKNHFYFWNLQVYHYHIYT